MLTVHVQIMYKIQVVFPPDKLATQPIAMSGRGGYTLPPGVHVYRFSFKVRSIEQQLIEADDRQLPFNNACIADQSNLPTFNLGGLTLDMVKAPSHHIKNPLPPSFAGFPGEADIRYFVKATIARPSILRENVRCVSCNLDLCYESRPDRIANRLCPLIFAPLSLPEPIQPAAKRFMQDESTIYSSPMQLKRLVKASLLSSRPKARHPLHFQSRP